MNDLIQTAERLELLVRNGALPEARALLSETLVSEKADPNPDAISIHGRLVWQQTLDRNGCQQVAVRPVALSTEDGTHEFNRVLGNTTGSHLIVAKASPYAELERF